MQPGSTFNVVGLVASLVQDPLLQATNNTVLLPFLNLLTGCMLSWSPATMARTPPHGSFVGGMNLFVTHKMSELPVLSLLHAALPQLGLDTRSVISSIGLLSTAGYRISAGALLNHQGPRYHPGQLGI